MFELIIGGAILAAATAVFKAFWDAVYKWCLAYASRYADKFLESFTTFVKNGYNVISYYYHREVDGWYKDPVPAQKVEKDKCPKSVRDALFDYDEVIVKRY